MEKFFVRLAWSLIALMFLHAVMRSFPDVPWGNYLPDALCSTLGCGSAYSEVHQGSPGLPDVSR